jgi:hypothetical protein
LRDAVSKCFHRTLEVRGNKHPRFTGFDEIEQSPILLGCPICSAVLHSHQNTLISSPSLSSPCERDFSKVDIQSHGARADGVFGSVQLHSDLTSLHVGERQRAQPFVVLRRPRTNFFFPPPSSQPYFFDFSPSSISRPMGFGAARLIFFA